MDGSLAGLSERSHSVASCAQSTQDELHSRNMPEKPGRDAESPKLAPSGSPNLRRKIKRMTKEPLAKLRHLELQHRTLDTELDLLMNQPRLTPAEYRHACELKKRKLAAKDGITALRQVLVEP
jgi:hypothetical protein